MSHEEVLKVVRRIAVDELEMTTPIEMSTQLVRDLQIDSMGMMTLAVGLEDAFRVRLNENDAATLQTVGDVVALVLLRVEQSAPGVA